MNKKKQNPASTRSTERKQRLLRDTGKTLRLRTALKAGVKYTFGDIIVS